MLEKFKEKFKNAFPFANKFLNPDGTISTMAQALLLKSPAVSAFSDIITANRRAQIVGNFYLGLTEDAATAQVTGSGTLSITGNPGFENLLTVASGTTAGSTAIVESNDALRYIPGYELGAFFTAVFQKPTDLAGHIRVGFMDANNGFWIGFQEVDGTMEFGVAIRKDGVDTFVKQSDFNRDKLDGQDESKMNVDFSKGNIYRIRTGYLGFAPPTFEIMLPDGEIIPFHQIEYPNKNVLTHISSTYISPRVEVANGAAAEDVFVKSGSISGYVADGDSVDVNNRDFSHIAEGLTDAGPHVRTRLVAFRNTGSFQGFLSPTAKDHKIPAKLNYFNLVLAGQNKVVKVELLIVPISDVAGGTWAKESDDSILDISHDVTISDYSNATLLYADILQETSDKISPAEAVKRLLLRPDEVAVFAVTSTTPQQIAWTLTNGWSELF